MARYFFDSGNLNYVVEDQVGIECTGLVGARQAGIEGLKDLTRDELEQSDGQELLVEVRDENGGKLMRLSIRLQVEATC